MAIIEKFVCRPAYVRLVLLLMGSLAFVAGGIFILFRSPDKWAGWMSIVFFGACSIVFVWQLLDSRPRLIIDDNGVFDRTLGVGVIPWRDIVDAYPMNLSTNPIGPLSPGNAFVCLVLRQPENYLNRLPRRRHAFSSLNRQLGFTDFSLNLIGIDVDPAVLCELIIKRVQLEQAQTAQTS